MLLSRFWYLILALALTAAVGGLYLATSVYNRASGTAMDQALAADKQVVSWYLNDDARRRSSLLLKAVLDETLRTQLAKASSSQNKVPEEARSKVRDALRKLNDEMPKDTFSALFAVDQYGRVIGQVGFDQASGNPDFELGGYPVVADALHGWVRDDAWVLDDRIYLIVARPVEVDTSQMPAGAVVGARIVDTSYVRQISKRSGAAIAFFAGGNVKAKAAPEGFDPTKLDTVVSDIGSLAKDKDYEQKGYSQPKILMGDVGVIYAKIAGEAWDLGAGYVVGRTASKAGTPLDLLQMADAGDKKNAPWYLLAPLFILAAGLGLIFTIFEHTRPLRTLRVEAERMAKGETDMLQVSKFRGVYRKIASDLNDGTDKVAAKGGVPRKAADLESVLGPIPAAPEMSAFSFPMEPGAAPPPTPSSPGPAPVSKPNIIQPPAPKPSGVQPPPPRQSAGVQPPPPKDIKLPPPKPDAAVAAKEPAVAAKEPAAPPAPSPATDQPRDEEDATVVSAIPPEILEASATGAHAAMKEADEISEWHNIYEEFLRTKKQCGEPTAGLTFEKFQGTLRKNREQLISKTGCKKVKFSVYVKDGRAALKASPIRE